MAKKASPGPVGDLFLAVSSIFLGFVVWVIVRQGDTVTKPVPVTVKLDGVAPIVDIQDFQPRSIPISFTMKKVDEGLTNALDQFSVTAEAGGIETRAGLNEFKDVPITIDPERSRLRHPQELTPASGDARVTITVRAMLKQAEARIVPNLGTVRPPAGFNIDYDRIEVRPESIKVAVAQRPGEGEEVTIGTEPVNLAGERKTAVKYAKLSYGEGTGVYELPGLEQPIIEVVVPIVEEVDTRTFTRVPIQYAPLKRGIRAELDPSWIDVTVTGPQSLVRSLSAEMMRLTPQSNQSLDREEPGESVDTAVDLTILSDEPRYQAEVKSALAPRVVTVRFHDAAAPLPPQPAPESEATVEGDLPGTGTETETGFR